MTDDERSEQRKELEKLGVTFIETPMLTDDGFVSPVFEAELFAAINGAWDDATRRCEEDPEWNTHPAGRIGERLSATSRIGLSVRLSVTTRRRSHPAWKRW